MIQRKRSGVLWIIALTLTLAATRNHAAEWNIEQLMYGLSQVRAARATFVEKKFIAILDKPVESSGELFYSAPDRLEKRTLKPRAESLLLEQGTLIISRGRQTHRLSLQDYPELSAFIDSIRGTLAGDRKALERSFRLTLTGTAEQWSLLLVPTNEKMLAVITYIRIGGVRDVMRSVEIMQADGDKSMMQVERLAAP